MSSNHIVHRTATNAAWFGFLGYACLEVAKNNMQTFSLLFDGAKVSYFVKNPIGKTPLIDSVHGGLCCALFVLIDGIAKYVFETINLKICKKNEFLLARMTGSLLLTAKITYLAGVTSTWPSAIALLCTSAITYAIMVSVFNICNNNWHSPVQIDSQRAVKA